jgi:hypothetical protein
MPHFYVISFSHGQRYRGRLVYGMDYVHRESSYWFDYWSEALCGLAELDEVKSRDG